MPQYKAYTCGLKEKGTEEEAGVPQSRLRADHQWPTDPAPPQAPTTSDSTTIEALNLTWEPSNGLP